jgi:hypothetical protein
MILPSRDALKFASYVILRHETDCLHYDLMFETEEKLTTYSIFQEPHFKDFEELRIQRIQDHRLKYLSYEGSISGGRGRVQRWDRGKYAGLTSEQFYLEGEQLEGLFEILPSEEESWYFFKKLFLKF